MQNVISIIVPVYNSYSTLNKCINSIINQTYKNLEIIIIDDGSIDESIKLCENYINKDERIKIISKKNGGVSSARNLGLEYAAGDYISFVDSDDYIEPYMYELLLKTIKKNNCDVAISNIYFETLNNNVIYDYNYEDTIFEKNYYPEKAYYIKSISGYVCNKLYSRNIIYYNDNEFIKFNTKIYIGEDDLFNYEVFNKNSNIRYSYINKKLYHYVLNNNSAINKKFNLNKLSYFHAKEIEINILRANNIRNDFLKADYIINFVRTIIIIKKIGLNVNQEYYNIKNKSKDYIKQINKSELPYYLKIKLFIALKIPYIYKLKLLYRNKYN